MEAALWTICDGHIFIEFDQLNCFLLNLGAGSYFAKIFLVPKFHMLTCFHQVFM